VSRIVLQHVGKVNGIDAFAPMAEEDVKAIGDRKVLVADLKGAQATRTSLQNRALHKFLTMLSEALNDAGWDLKKTLERKPADIPWSLTTAKELLWHPIQEAMFDTRSTAKLNSDEVSKVYDVLNRHTSEKLGVSVEFPDKRSI
jgi:hypothetical protein